MSHEKIEFLRNKIKPLFRTISQTDFKAMRFQKDVLEISLAALSEENDKYSTLKDSLIEQISELPLSVNIVAKEEILINKAQTNHYWATAIDDTFNELSLKLAPLAKFRNIGGPETGHAIFDFKDSIFLKEMVEFGPEHESISISKYREMVEKMILELTLTNPVLQKIKQGEAVSESQINELADALHEEHPHITINLLRKTYNNPKAKFIQFIRHILGLEVLESFSNTVTKAFDEFIKKHSNLNSRQMNFLNLLKEVMIERESIKKRDLIESPFTIMHPKGIRGIFTPSEIDEILILTKELAA